MPMFGECISDKRVKIVNKGAEIWVIKLAQKLNMKFQEKV